MDQSLFVYNVFSVQFSLCLIYEAVLGTLFIQPLYQFKQYNPEHASSLGAISSLFFWHVHLPEGFCKVPP